VLFPSPNFFPKEEFNLTELLLRDRDDNGIAIYAAREDSSEVETVRWSQLRERVRQVYDALTSGGLKPGDVVGVVITNSVDAIVICLATLAHGAIWSSASCDLGSKALLDRWLQIKPKFVFAESGYTYAGKQFNLGDRTVEWSTKLAQSNKDFGALVILSQGSKSTQG
jgi:acetoacetyl-CoA synthetase